MGPPCVMALSVYNNVINMQDAQPGFLYTSSDKLLSFPIISNMLANIGANVFRRLLKKLA